MRPLTQQAGIDTCVPCPVLDPSPALSPGHPDGLPEDHTALRGFLDLDFPEFKQPLPPCPQQNQIYTVWVLGCPASPSCLLSHGLLEIIVLLQIAIG